jgi:riboflavin kinase/FMN adenylyltransferase
MAVLELDWNELPPACCRGGGVTVGNFDGVHRGHAALVAELRRHAASIQGPAVVLTFEPHPLLLLRPDQFEPVLTTGLQRADLLHRCGADHVILLRTTPALLNLTAKAFFQLVLRERLAVRALVEGTNFGFGRNREGDVETLGSMCRASGTHLSIVPPVLMGETPVSSSRVRRSLLAGDVPEAANLLGRNYCLEGKVGAGRQRGRTIGFPTANLEEIPTLVPGDGVYAVRVFLRESVWAGAANIGPNPTFGENTRKVEVHLIDFQGDLLGQTLRVEFVERLRDTYPFAGVRQLVEQLHLDIEQARRLAK